jgi:hypothetical protein
VFESSGKDGGGPYAAVLHGVRVYFYGQQIVHRTCTSERKGIRRWRMPRWRYQLIHQLYYGPLFSARNARCTYAAVALSDELHYTNFYTRTHDVRQTNYLAVTVRSSFVRSFIRSSFVRSNGVIGVHLHCHKRNRPIDELSNRPSSHDGSHHIVGN